jgi:hypothetical protein
MGRSCAAFASTTHHTCFLVSGTRGMLLPFRILRATCLLLPLFSQHLHGLQHPREVGRRCEDWRVVSFSATHPGISILQTAKVDFGNSPLSNFTPLTTPYATERPVSNFTLLSATSPGLVSILTLQKLYVDLLGRCGHDADLLACNRRWLWTFSSRRFSSFTPLSNFTIGLQLLSASSPVLMSILTLHLQGRYDRGDLLV